MAVTNVFSDNTEKLHFLAADFPVCVEDNRLSACRVWESTGHWHKGFQFIIVLEGEMDCRVSQQSMRVGRGQAVFINENRLHYCFAVSSADCVFNCIVLASDLLGDMQTPMGRYTMQLAAESAADCLLIDESVSPQHKQLLALLLGMREAGLGKKAMYELTLQSLWGQTVQILYQILPPAENNFREQQEWMMIRSMTRFVQNHYAQRISVKEIAEAGLICRSKCVRLFRAHLNTTPNAYLLHYRLLRASALLLHTDMPITEIAMSCGFGGSSYFTEMFHRSFKQTPTEMRKTGQLPAIGGA